MHKEGSRDQLAARNVLWKSKVVQMIHLGSKEYLNFSFKLHNDVTIPCNLKDYNDCVNEMSFGNIDMLKTGSI